MSTDFFKKVNFVDGEGLTHTDFNNIGLYQQAAHVDRFCERTVAAIALGNDLGASFLDPEVPGELGDRAVGAVLGASLAFTAGPGECMIYPSTATAVKIGAGTIFQKLSAVTGDGATFVPYSIKNADLTFTVSAGHATNPRFDIIQVKIDEITDTATSRDFEDATTRIVSTITPNIAKRYQLTASYKTGTAAATPTMPFPDAGYVTLAAVRVPATWTTGIDDGSDVGIAGSLAIIMQMAIPLGVKSFTVLPNEFYYGQATNWGTAPSASGIAVSAGAATNLRIYAPQLNEGRIVGVAIEAVGVTSQSVRLGRVRISAGVAGFTSWQTLTTMMDTAGTNKVGYASLTQIAGNSSPASTTQWSGAPLWTNGTFVPSLRVLQNIASVTFPQAGSAKFSRACLSIDAGNTSTVSSVRWFIAGV